MNHKLFSILVFFFGIHAAFAQTGVNFLHSYDEAIAAAAKENKLIFMDAYTTWCGPCKMLNRNVFPDPQVAEYYNANFINLKIDMEKDNGPILAQKFQIYAYPTLLFIDRFGKVVHRVAGYRNPQQFIELGKEASDPSKHLGSMTAKYDGGERSPEFLLDYSKALYETHAGGHQKVAEAYLATQKDWGTELNSKFLFTMLEDIQSPMFEYLQKNTTKFDQFYGKDVVSNRIESLIYQSINNLGSDASMAEIDAVFEKAYPKSAKEFSAKYRLTQYLEKEDYNRFAEESANFVKKFKVKDSDFLNDIAYNFYTSIDDPKLLKQGIKIAKKSIRLDKNYYNMDTLAALYYKIGKKSKAAKAAKTAIAIAKKDGDTYDSTENLLKEIEKL